MKRLLAGLLVGICMLFTTAPAAQALTPTYAVTGSYKSSKYHKNVLSITKTGDEAFDTVAAALSQLDYHEGNSSADFNGGNSTGSKNYTEYNRALGKISGSYSYAWCAAFVSWCLDVAGAKDSAGGSFASCTLWVEKLQSMGLYSTRASGYTPKAGDLIFFRSAGTTRASDHIGIVRYVKNGRVYTVEGNSSNKVTLRDYKQTDTYIVGYGKPRYGGAPLGKTALELEDRATGLYTVTNSFVNVRGSASSSGTKLGTLYRGTLVEITKIENGWGRFTYNGKDAYISLDYADFTTPVIHTVTYEAEDSQGGSFKEEYFSFETGKATAEIPERKGHDFLYWISDSGATYKQGDALPSGDLVLRAVWDVQKDDFLTDDTENGEADNGGNSDILDSPFGGGEENDALLDLETEDGETAAEDAALAARRSEAAKSAAVTLSVLAASLGLYWYIRKYLV